MFFLLVPLVCFFPFSQGSVVMISDAKNVLGVLVNPPINRLGESYE